LTLSHARSGAPSDHVGCAGLNRRPLNGIDNFGLGHALAATHNIQSGVRVVNATCKICRFDHNDGAPLGVECLLGLKEKILSDEPNNQLCDSRRTCEPRGIDTCSVYKAGYFAAFLDDKVPTTGLCAKARVRCDGSRWIKGWNRMLG
jgi:hypothetical protein